MRVISLVAPRDWHLHGGRIVCEVSRHRGEVREASNARPQPAAMPAWLMQSDRIKIVVRDAEFQHVLARTADLSSARATSGSIFHWMASPRQIVTRSRTISTIARKLVSVLRVERLNLQDHHVLGGIVVNVRAFPNT
jgi:hypothetical protein